MRGQLQRADVVFHSTQTSSERFRFSSLPLPSPFSPWSRASGLGTGRGRRGCCSPHAFPPGVRVSVVLGFLWPWRDGWTRGGGGVFWMFRFLSNACFPALPIPQLPSASVFPETSQGNGKKSRRLSHHLPPGACAPDWAASSARAYASVRVGRARAPCGAGRFALTMKGTGFSPLPPRSVVAPARWGNSPGLWRGEGQSRSARIVAPRACAAGRLCRTLFSALLAVASLI